MSEVFAQTHQRNGPAPNPETISNMLEENSQLVTAICEYYNKNRMNESLE